MLNLLLIYFLCGSLTGLLSGLFGIGGGIVGIPLLFALFMQQGISEQLALHMAIATMLATIVPASFMAAYRNLQNQLIDFVLFRKIIPGLLIGALLGAIISSNLDPLLLRKIFAVFLCLIAFHMIWHREARVIPILLNQKVMLIMAFLIGILCALLGLGGGVLIVPYLHLVGLDTKHAIATSTACIFPVAILSAISYVLLGIHQTETYSYSSGFIYWPAFLGMSIAAIIFAPIGANLMLKIPEKLLNLTFISLMLLIAWKMF